MPRQSRPWEGSLYMFRWCLAAAVAVALTCAFVPVAGAKQRKADRLEVYSAVLSSQQFQDLQAKGLDVEGEPTARGVKAQLILTAGQRAQLAADGISTKL